MKGIYIGTNGTIAVINDTLDYSQLSTLVGGALEGIYTLDGQPGYANGEGIILGLPINYPASHLCGHGIVGNVILVSVDGEGNSISVPTSYIHHMRTEWIVQTGEHTVVETRCTINKEVDNA